MYCYKIYLYKNEKAIKKNLLHILAIVVLIGGIFISSQSVFSQPAPDEHFCVVAANLIFGDSVCKVGGHGPLYYNFDDGDAEDYALWVESGGTSVVKFIPPGDFLGLVAGEIYVGDGSFPIGADFLGTDFQVVVYDDDGPEGFPGTLLDSLIVTVENYGWVTFGGLNVVIEEGAFYMGMQQLGVPPSAAPVGIDTDPPTMQRSYIKRVGEDWILSPYQDFMIRAKTCWAGYLEREVVSENSSWYQIARISDFDPNLGEGPEDGTLTIIDSVNIFYYSDTLFYAYPPAYYAYAVRIFQGDSASTGWYYTNIISKFPDGTGDQNRDSNQIQVFPNPASKVLKISSSKKMFSVRIINAIGQSVFEKSTDDNEFTIQTGFLKSGFYLLQVQTEDENTVRKVLINQ